MKIGEPVAEVPQAERTSDRFAEKYTAVYRRLKELPDEEWLPVTFETKQEARAFRASCDCRKRQPIEAKARNKGLTIYVRETRDNGAERANKEFQP